MSTYNICVCMCMYVYISVCVCVCSYIYIHTPGLHYLSAVPAEVPRPASPGPTAKALQLSEEDLRNTERDLKLPFTADSDVSLVCAQRRNDATRCVDVRVCMGYVDRPLLLHHSL